jgi:hypothetical protein
MRAPPLYRPGKGARFSKIVAGRIIHYFIIGRVVGAQTPPAPEIRGAAGFVQAADISTPRCPSSTRFAQLPSKASASRTSPGRTTPHNWRSRLTFALPLAGVPAQAEVDDRSARQGDHRPDARNVRDLPIVILLGGDSIMGTATGRRLCHAPIVTLGPSRVPPSPRPAR